MKTARRPSSILALLALVASAVSLVSPVSADESSYMADKSAYMDAAANFRARARVVVSFQNSPSGLGAWTRSTVDLGGKLLAAANTMSDRIKTEANLLYANQGDSRTAQCNVYKAQWFGAYQSEFGTSALTNDFGSKLEDLYIAQQDLANSENKLLSRIGQQVADKQKVDPLQRDLLNATQSAQKQLQTLYQAMLGKANALSSERGKLEANINGPQCLPGAHAEPTPTAKPKPTPTPTPAPKTAQTQKPGSGPTPPNIPCKGKWEFWPGFGWVCVG